LFDDVGMDRLETVQTVRLEKVQPKDLVIVQCMGFRCAAYRDDQGKWREFCRDVVLPDNIRIMEPAM